MCALCEVKIFSIFCRAGISNQLEQMQCDLDTLEELLGGLQYNFSNDTLKGVNDLNGFIVCCICKYNDI